MWRLGNTTFFSPGEADRGQPTHFLPRRNRFTFEVTVPSDWGDRELVWTLNVNGVERRHSLRSDKTISSITWLLPPKQALSGQEQAAPNLEPISLPSLPCQATR